MYDFNDKRRYKYFIFFLFISIVIFLIIYLNNININEQFYIKECTEDLLTKKSHHNKLLNMVDFLHKTFVKFDIWYIMSFGTLLGSIRDKKIIPWDDDIDIVILRKDLKKILSLSSYFSRHGFTMRKSWKIVRIYFDDSVGYSNPAFIDLFVWDIVGNKSQRVIIEKNLYKNLNFNNYPSLAELKMKYKIECRKNKPRFCYIKYNRWWERTGGTRIPISNLMPRKLYRLNDLYLYGPNNPIVYLEDSYGKNWNKEYKITHKHISDGTRGSEIQTRMDECMFSQKKMKEILKLY